MNVRLVFIKAIAEAIGTFALVFFGCGSIAMASMAGSATPAFAVPIVFGLAVATMVYAVGHISGAHFNPAVTLGFAVVKRFPAGQILPYWAGQFSGAIGAVLVLKFLLPATASYGATVPMVPAIQAVLWEAVLMFFLMLVIIALATDARAARTMAGVAIGASVTLGAMAGGPFTGASMNPFRSLAPAILEGKLEFMWIYITGPVLGAVIASLVYERLRCETRTDNKAAEKDAKGCC